MDAPLPQRHMNRAAPLTLPCSRPSWRSAHTVRNGETSPSPQLTQVNTYQESPQKHTSIHTRTYICTYTHTHQCLVESLFSAVSNACLPLVHGLTAVSLQTDSPGGRAGGGTGQRVEVASCYKSHKHTLHVCHCMHACPSLVRHDK